MPADSTIVQHDGERRDLIELHRLARESDDAFMSLFRRFRPRVYRLARQYFLPGADTDDLLQEATIGFYKAVRDYRPERGSLSGFVETCVRRQLITSVKSATRLKHRLLNRAVSLDAPISHTEHATLLDKLCSHSADVHENDVDELKNLLEARCSPLEAAVLGQLMRASSHAEIATELGLTAKAVNNAAWRVREKAYALLSELRAQN